MSADLALLASDPGSALGTAADPGQFVLLACQRAKEWLAQAVVHGEIEQIVELKSQAEAIRVYTAQKQIGKDAELAAAEIVRRAERGIGLAIRKGQQAGEIRKQGDQPPGPRRAYERVRNGKRELIQPVDRPETDMLNGARSPKEFFSNGQEGHEVYALTDGVTDAQFNDAIETAKAEGNLSRRNVVRKVRGVTDIETAAGRRARIAELAAQGMPSRQIAELVGITDEQVRVIARKHGIEIPADRIFSGTRRTDSNRIVRETAHALEGLALGVQLLNADDLDAQEVRDYATSLTNSMRVLNRLVKQIKEIAQ